MTSLEHVYSSSSVALANRHPGLRGNLDEGEPYGLPGTYLNSFWRMTSDSRSILEARRGSHGSKELLEGEK
ncbi:glycoside hydrolase family 65 domain protein [Ktedonobacter racemifer DSM 44963]|uniref:Glycoside hydrolase family 65 domain protein n=1 Tax=Ktedonobacter racemifer DSM 44963 TaxID=485913 RepID=D6TTL3_KTERA|nr:glycoside hydrolase family 65 domain protein [Ktedonobacter racemifer DSM 44963]